MVNTVFSELCSPILHPFTQKLGQGNLTGTSVDSLLSLLWDSPRNLKSNCINKKYFIRTFPTATPPKKYVILESVSLPISSSFFLSKRTSCQKYIIDPPTWHNPNSTYLETFLSLLYVTLSTHSQTLTCTPKSAGHICWPVSIFVRNIHPNASKCTYTINGFLSSRM